MRVGRHNAFLAVVLLIYVVPVPAWRAVAANTGRALAGRPVRTAYVAASASPTGPAASDDAAALQMALREVREARAEAAEAQNAEARLRSMVRAADQNAELNARKAADAEEERDEALDELEALRTLSTLEQQALEETVDDLKESVGKLQAQLRELDDESADSTEAASEGDEAREEAKSARQQSALQQELSEAKLDAERHRLLSEDLSAELAAVQQLAAEARSLWRECP